MQLTKAKTSLPALNWENIFLRAKLDFWAMMHNSKSCQPNESEFSRKLYLSCFETAVSHCIFPVIG